MVPGMGIQYSLLTAWTTEASLAQDAACAKMVVMSSPHLVRVGAMGQIGRFAAVDAVRYRRHGRVIVRTRRGLEIGEVLAPPADQGAETLGKEMLNGQILRAMTTEDLLLESRLEKNRQAAYSACARLLQKKNLPAVLLDVEHLFDGQGLFFYFLGEVSPELEACTEQLAETYEAKVQFRKFTETLIEGCGPNCGTEAATGKPGCESCTGCAVIRVAKHHKSPVIFSNTPDFFSPSAVE